MSSRDGFPRADLDTSYYHDPKLVALARRLKDPARTMVAAGLHQATILASWHGGRRVTLVEAAPAWYLADPVEYLADLQAVGLLDGEGRIPEHAYMAWTARARAASEAARTANRKRWGEPSEDPTGLRPDSDRTPTRSGPNPQPTYLPTGLPAGKAEEVAPPAPAPARGDAVDSAEAADGVPAEDPRVILERAIQEAPTPADRARFERKHRQLYGGGTSARPPRPRRTRRPSGSTQAIQ